MFYVTVYIDSCVYFSAIHVLTALLTFMEGNPEVNFDLLSTI